MALLTLEDIHVTIGDRHLLQGVSLVVGEDERIGLLGANGCGKSTLLRILAGALQPDLGNRAVRRDLRLGYLPQEPTLPPDAKVHDVVVDGIPGRTEVVQALARVHAALADEADADRITKLLKEQERLDLRLEQLGGHGLAVVAGLHALQPIAGGDERGLHRLLPDLVGAEVVIAAQDPWLRMRLRRDLDAGVEMRQPGVDVAAHRGEAVVVVVEVMRQRAAAAGLVGGDQGNSIG